MPRRPITDTSLPIDAALPDLLAALGTSSTAILVAPPGAGKTTRVPLALLGAAWRGDGRILVLEPRRLAARGAARRMAETLGERLGETVGLRARMDVAVSARTRIEVITQGVFTRMILDDPELTGVAAVLFDEFHERSLDADLGLVFARDAQGALREDLRLLVMSATLNASGLASLLGDAPVVESLGRMFPVETHYLGRPQRERGERLEVAVAAGVRRALRDGEGDVLAFLPGQGEIARAFDALGDLAEAEVVTLHGGLDRRAQDRAVRPGDGRRVVLATAIAESSLTIPGVRAVVDAGLSRRPRFDPGSGITRLETGRVSRASADQRRGRAGRLGPGRCYRLWDEPETRALIPFDPPEIASADLGPLALALTEWGVADANALTWATPPPAGPLAEARALLSGLGALGETGITPYGRALARLPLPPRLAHMLLRAPERDRDLAGRIAVLLTERGLGGAAPDITHRLDGWTRDGGPRAREAQAMAKRWVRMAEAAMAGEGGSRAAHGRAMEAGTRPAAGGADRVGALVALAYPERVALRRPEAVPQKGGPKTHAVRTHAVKPRAVPRADYATVSGRGATIEADAPLARHEGLAIAELTGAGASGRIALAAPLSRDAIEALFADRAETRTDVAWDEMAGAVRARRIRAIGALVLDSAPAPVPIVAGVPVLMERLGAIGVARLPWDAAAERLRARIALLEGQPGDADWPSVSDDALLDTLGTWLAPFLPADALRLDVITPGLLREALLSRLTFDGRRRLDAEAPAELALKAVRVPVDYGAGAPAVSARVQAFYGLDTHPVLAGAPVTLTLLSPARRPLQTTRDLPGFWRGSWSAVRAEMRGRYPKHDWPERPWEAAPGERI